MKVFDTQQCLCQSNTKLISMWGQICHFISTNPFCPSSCYQTYERGCHTYHSTFIPLGLLFAMEPTEKIRIIVVGDSGVVSSFFYPLSLKVG